MPAFRAFKTSRASDCKGIILGLIAAAFILVPSADSYAQFMMRDISAPFDLSVSQGFEKDNTPVILLNGAIDYRRLVFFKKDDYYESRYRVYVEIRNEKDKSVDGQVWEDKVTVPTYKDTRSHTTRSTINRKFPIETGEFRVNVKIEVIGTSLKYEASARIRIVGGKDDAIGISDPVFMMPSPDSREPEPPSGEIGFSLCDYHSQDRSNTLAGGVFLDFDSWLKISYGLVLPDSARAGSGIVLSIRVTDSFGDVVCYSKKHIPAGELENTGLCLGLNVDHFEIGRYTISLKAEIPGTDTKTTAEDDFIVLLNKGLLYEHFPQMLEILSLVADDDELKALKEAPPGQREDEWYSFWKKRDPTSGTTLNETMSEFLRRLRFALNNFSSRRPGWRTDMGRIYIGYGAPDRITDNTGVQFSYGSDYQLWYYDSRGIVYIFMRDIGSGEYRLVDTQMM